MEVLRNAKNHSLKKNNHVHWLRLVILFVIVLAISFGLAYLLDNLVNRLQLPINELQWLAYAVVFGTALVGNMTIIAPVPFPVSIMIAVAREWNPLIVALFGAAGGTLGELSGYYAGYLGKKIAMRDSLIGHGQVEGWIQRYGMWAIAGLAFQPIIPFDIGGLVAGLAKMPLHKFLPGLFIGKFPKYALITFGFIKLIDLIDYIKQMDIWWLVAGIIVAVIITCIIVGVIIVRRRRTAPL